MTIGLTYNDDLSRVQIAISDRPNGTVMVQRVANAAATEALWARSVVRGGHALPVVGGVATLDDFEFFADIPNFYRVTQIGLEDAVDVFTASGTWNKPPGLTAVRVIVVPGGSGGGGSAATGVGQASVGNGGATGPVVISVIDAALLGASEIVTIGPGGVGNLGITGGTGGTSSFGSHASAVGPAGGAVIPAANTNDSGLGTAASTTGTGQVVGAGSPGGGGLRYIGLGNGGLRGGYGGSGPFGSGGRGATGLAAGEAASGFGAGGGGATSTPSSGARAGGAGSPGLIIVEHIFV